MSRTLRRAGAVAVAAFAALCLTAWVLWPDGDAARIERRSACYAPANMPPVTTGTDGRARTRLSILLWNVEGLPWPARAGRTPKLARIAAWMAHLRKTGRAPDILLLHKAFTPAASHIAVAGGYGNVVPGPARAQQRRLPAVSQPPGFAAAARWIKGERLAPQLDSGLYLATDLPLADARAEPFGRGRCAGYDCLANKGAIAAHVVIPGAPQPLMLFNSHRQSLYPSGVAPARAEAAHVMQTRANDALIAASRHGGEAMLGSGDFNGYRAGDRSGFFARDPRFRLIVPTAGGGYAARTAKFDDPRAWQALYDLLGFAPGGTVRIEPLAVTTLFDGVHAPALADHPAVYAIVQLSWDARTVPARIPVGACR